MKCPACGRELVAVAADGIIVHGCHGGCGGIFLEKLAYQKVSAPEEPLGESLLHIDRDESIQVDQSRKRQCPRCDGFVMKQQFSSVKKQVVIEECVGCGGVWLDGGELALIRGEFASSEERRKAQGQAAKQAGAMMTVEMLAKRQQAEDEAEQMARVGPGGELISLLWKLFHP